MDGGKESGQRKRREEGERRRARGVSLLWQAKTAAALKLQCSTTVPQGCVFALVSAYICVFVGKWEEQGHGGNTGQRWRGKEGVREGRDRREDLVIFCLVRC